MCRLALYLGPARPIGDLLDAAHGLAVQSYAPRELQHGTVNVDGTGFAWWRDGDDLPLRYVTVRPPWADANLAALAPRLTGHTILGVVRGGTPGVGHGDDHVAPFVLGDLAVAHNGWVGGFRDGVAAGLLRALPDDLLAGLPVINDSRVLASLLVAHRREGRALPDAVRTLLADVAAAARAAGQPATLNLAVTDGREAVVTRASVDLPGNSLYLAEDAAAWPGAIVVASEPLDGHDDLGHDDLGHDDLGHRDWSPVADGSLLHLTRGPHGPAVAVQPLTEEPA